MRVMREDGCGQTDPHSASLILEKARTDSNIKPNALITKQMTDGTSSCLYF